MARTPAGRVLVGDRLCETCGKALEIKVYPSGSQESSTEYLKRRFCGRKCKGVSQRLANGPKLGGLPHRGRKIARRMVVKSACEKCGTSNRLEVHHRDGDATNNDRDNLQALCMPCHRKEHKGVGCLVDGCNGKFLAFGYCSKHYQRFVKYGDPMVKCVGRVGPVRCEN